MTVRIFFKTLPYLFLRLVVYLLFALILLFALAVMGGIGFVVAMIFKEAAAGPLIFIAIITIPILWALTRLLQRYLVYLVRAGHVAVITELVKKGELPKGEGQIGFGKNKVITHFGETSVLFAVDQIVRRAVRQILGWLTSAAGCLAEIPGMGLVIAFIKRVLSIAGNYIDEAVLSYIISHEEEKNVWKTAADGVVLYAQSWKSLLKTALFVALAVMAIWLTVFIISLVILLPIATYGGLAKVITTQPQAQSGLKFLFGIIALILAFIVANIVKWVLVDPLSTVAMIVSYDRAIEGVEPSYDLYGQLSQISGKFRELTTRAKEAGKPPEETKPPEA